MCPVSNLPSDSLSLLSSDDDDEEEEEQEEEELEDFSSLSLFRSPSGKPPYLVVPALLSISTSRSASDFTARTTVPPSMVVLPSMVHGTSEAPWTFSSVLCFLFLDSTVMV